MIRYKYFLLLIVLSVLSSCSSSKKTVSSANKIEDAKSREQELLNESDVVFDKFKRNSSSGLNNYTLAYIDEYKHIAIEKMVEYHIPASITLSQGILESGNGRSELTRKANNHFGIKCHKGWKGKKVYHDDDKRKECFRKYGNPVGSFNDHSLFLTSRGRYSSLFELHPDNYKGWAKGLKKAGYATDRKYPSKLINIIEDYKLYEFDDLVLEKKWYTKNKPKKRQKEYQQSSSYIVVNKGDTLYSIAKNNSTTVDQLMRDNDLSSHELDVGQKIYLNR